MFLFFFVFFQNAMVKRNVHERRSFLSCPNIFCVFFGSLETSFGTFGLEFEDVIVLPVFQFTVAKGFYVIYFIQIKSCCNLSAYFLAQFLFCRLHLTLISHFYCHTSRVHVHVMTLVEISMRRIMFSNPFFLHQEIYVTLPLSGVCVYVCTGKISIQTETKWQLPCMKFDNPVPLR